ncbi:hypothetical protein CC80DRAFT_487610 [Byssothecium circinans]|uniref:Uncharacterized protein n=1 Tax=Byssothecium circinans TaxID=147558 RepID=A0A6A5UEP1_9PLEO|nr:hypothetical protein CC80DRAFT_487610 [Byssothecium circinans]
MLHALANQAIGFFYEELQWALSNNATHGASTARLMALLTILTLLIPTHSPLVPLVLEALKSFSTCYLPMITDLSFFLDDEWIGYAFLNVENLPFNGIRGHNLEGCIDMLRVIVNKVNRHLKIAHRHPLQIIESVRRRAMWG